MALKCAATLAILTAYVTNKLASGKLLACWATQHNLHVLVLEHLKCCLLHLLLLLASFIVTRFDFQVKARTRKCRSIAIDDMLALINWLLKSHLVHRAPSKVYLRCGVPCARWEWCGLLCTLQISPADTHAQPFKQQLLLSADRKQKRTRRPHSLLSIPPSSCLPFWWRTVVSSAVYHCAAVPSNWVPAIPCSRVGGGR